MGVHSSKNKSSILRRRDNHEVKVHTSTKGRGQQVRRKYVSGWALLARPWEVVCEETADKWRKSKVAQRFPPFPVCTRKPTKDNPMSSSRHWHSDACLEAVMNKPTSQIQYQAHGALVRQTLSYNSNNLLEKTMNEGRLDKIMPSTGGYLALYYTYRSLDDVTYGIMPLLSLSKHEMLYFFVDKSSTRYEPHGLAVSPDATIVCLLLSRLIPQGGSHRLFEVQVYSRRPMAFDSTFHGPTFELEYEVPGLQPHTNCPKVMFDPRYHSSRLGIINVNSVQNIHVSHYFLVYDLRRKCPITNAHDNNTLVYDVDDLELLDAAYSPDGHWVHALFAHSHDSLEQDSTVGGELNRQRGAVLWIINSDTLEVVRALEIGGHESLSPDSCYINYQPVYSLCTRQMAVRHRKTVKVYKLPPPSSLKAQCRAVILARYRDRVDRLDTTQQLKDYIKLKPYL